jgi:hypothetical protein
MSRELKASDSIGLNSATVDELKPFALANVCQVSITHPTPAITVSVTGTGDPDLNPVDGGFVEVLNGYEEVLKTGSLFTVLADGRVQINKSGYMIITAYSDISHTSNGTTVGATFTVERGGSTVYSPRSVHARMPNAGDIGNLSGAGSLAVVTGDIIGVALASDVTGTISVRASSLVFQFIGE